MHRHAALSAAFLLAAVLHFQLRPVPPAANSAYPVKANTTAIHVH